MQIDIEKWFYSAYLCIPMSGPKSETFGRDKYANCLSALLTPKSGISLDHNRHQMAKWPTFFRLFPSPAKKRMVKKSIRRAKQRFKRCINRIHIRAWISNYGELKAYTKHKQNPRLSDRKKGSAQEMSLFILRRWISKSVPRTSRLEVPPGTSPTHTWLAYFCSL